MVKIMPELGRGWRIAREIKKASAGTSGTRRSNYGRASRRFSRLKKTTTISMNATKSEGHVDAAMVLCLGCGIYEAAQ